MNRYSPMVLQASTATAEDAVTHNVRDYSEWSIQIDLGGATADITLEGRVHPDAEWVDIASADLSGSTGMVLQSFSGVPLSAIQVSWESLSGGSIAVYFFGLRSMEA